MDNKERFDQVERLLADLMQKADRQDEFNTRQEAFNTRVEQRLASIDDRLDGITDVLKLFAEAQKQAEERHEQLIKEIREQGRRTDRTQAEILQILDRMETQQAKTDDHARQLENHAPRIQRLEDEAFGAAN